MDTQGNLLMEKRLQKDSGVLRTEIWHAKKQYTAHISNTLL